MYLLGKRFLLHYTSCEARGSGGSIRDQALQLLEPVVDQDVARCYSATPPQSDCQDTLGANTVRSLDGFRKAPSFRFVHGLATMRT